MKFLQVDNGAYPLNVSTVENVMKAGLDDDFVFAISRWQMD